MELRRAVPEDLNPLAALAEPLQRRPDRHIAYLGTDADVIAVELPSEDEDWTAVTAVAEVSGEIVGWLMGSMDVEMGRIWWYGPFVSDLAESGPTAGPGLSWSSVAEALLDHAGALVPAEVSQFEWAIDPNFVDLERLALQRGYVVDPGSVILTRPLDDVGPPVDQGAITVAPAVPEDLNVIGPLHDRLFVDTHLPGHRLLEDPDGLHRRLVARRAESETGEPVGYVALQRNPDGEAYIDFIGVDPDARRLGVGKALIEAALAAGVELGCHRAALTVREANDGARALYRSTGFTEERVLRPLRKGFRLL